MRYGLQVNKKLFGLIKLKQQIVNIGNSYFVFKKSYFLGVRYKKTIKNYSASGIYGKV